MYTLVLGHIEERRQWKSACSVDLCANQSQREEAVQETMEQMNNNLKKNGSAFVHFV